MVQSGFLIGATKSGSGKTLLTLGILAALAKRGMAVQPFKCGPDFIDPTLHQMVAERPSLNLDLHMMGQPACRQSFERHAAGTEVTVVEGVMGLFDGGDFSSAALALALELPVVLIVDVRSAAESVAAVVKGFEVFNPATRICGVLLNQVGSKRHAELIQRAVQRHCSAEILGFFPRNIAFELPSRHLGLHMGSEVALADEQVDQLVEAIETNIDIDLLLQCTRLSIPNTSMPADTVAQSAPRLRLGVARDEAFCFYYQDNLELFRANGFEVEYFSPLNDTSLPENLDAIYLGGGYPELFAKRLSDNSKMRQKIWHWADKGKALYAECGGFMYLTERILDLTGRSFEMAGVFPATVKMKEKFSRLGYRTVQLRKDCLLGSAGTTCYGHEFHYSEIVAMSETVERVYELGDGVQEGFHWKNVLGSYVHLHFAQTPACIRNIYNKARQPKECTR